MYHTIIYVVHANYLYVYNINFSCTDKAVHRILHPSFTFRVEHLNGTIKRRWLVNLFRYYYLRGREGGSFCLPITGYYCPKRGRGNACWGQRVCCTTISRYHHHRQHHRQQQRYVVVIVIIIIMIYLSSFMNILFWI